MTCFTFWRSLIIVGGSAASRDVTVSFEREITGSSSVITFRHQLVQVELADLHRHLARLDTGDVENLAMIVSRCRPFESMRVS